MSTEVSYGRKALGFCICLDGCSDITEVVARTRLLNAKFSTAFGNVQESQRLTVKLPHSKGDAGIADPTAITHSNIDANDISIFKNMLRVGDAVTDHVINGSTNGGGGWRNGGGGPSFWAAPPDLFRPVFSPPEGKILFHNT